MYLRSPNYRKKTKKKFLRRETRIGFHWFDLNVSSSTKLLWIIVEDCGILKIHSNIYIWKERHGNLTTAKMNVKASIRVIIISLILFLGLSSATVVTEPSNVLLRTSKLFSICVLACVSHMGSSVKIPYKCVDLLCSYT